MKPMLINWTFFNREKQRPYNGGQTNKGNKTHPAGRQLSVRGSSWDVSDAFRFGFQFLSTLPSHCEIANLSLGDRRKQVAGGLKAVWRSCSWIMSITASMPESYWKPASLSPSLCVFVCEFLLLLHVWAFNALHRFLSNTSRVSVLYTTLRVIIQLFVG